MSDNGQRDQVVKLIGQALAERPHIDDVDRFTVDTELSAAGMDSLDLIVVFSYFEKHWSIPFDDEEVNPALFETLGGLAATLLEQARAHGKELV